MLARPREFREGIVQPGLVETLEVPRESLLVKSDVFGLLTRAGLDVLRAFRRIDRFSAGTLSFAVYKHRPRRLGKVPRGARRGCLL